MSTVEELPTSTDNNGIEWRARFIQWGRGKFHIQTGALGDETVCGRTIGEPAQSTIYSCTVCSRCASDVEAHAAAESYREALRGLVAATRTKRLESNRAGVFTVVRCKLCGVQHASPRTDLGVAFCMGAGHEAQLEEIEVTGPVWKEPSQ